MINKKQKKRNRQKQSGDDLEAMEIIGGPSDNDLAKNNKKSDVKEDEDIEIL